MNVQGASASIARGERAPVGSGGVSATAAIAQLGAKPAPAPGPAPSSNVASASRIAFAVSQTRLNQQVTGSQRSLAFLDKAGQQLLDLKGALASSLAGRPASRMEVDQGLNRVNVHWSGRHAATGGTLGSDLVFHEDGAAPQFFRIRGFELRSLLQTENAETLNFYPKGSGKPPVSLAISAGRHDTATTVYQLDRTLAPAGIRASLDKGGALVFSTAEDNWPGLRDHLMIRGGGSRFPGGQPSRAVAEALAGAVEPQKWSVADPMAQRATLRRVVQALDQVTAAHTAVREVFDSASDAIRDGARADMGARVAVPAFSSMLARSGDFQMFSAIGSALRRVTRQGVVTLLKAG
jgi:hypothetical protein